jgi:uncharacterized protein (UPF0305 family)
MNDIDNKIRNEALLAELLNGKDLRIKELETTLEIWHELMREKNKEIAMSDEVNRGLANRNHDLKMMIEAPENDNDIVDKLEHRIYDLKKERSEMKEALIEVARINDEYPEFFAKGDNLHSFGIEYAKLIEKLKDER